MARCFPFVSKEYLRTVVKEPLIESIKLQKVRENTKERKKEKKEKKEKKIRNEKSKEHQGNLKDSQHNHKKRKYSGSLQLSGEDCSTKSTNDAIEQLEKSSVTEENGPPFSYLNLYDSSDSNQDSSKRRKLAAPNIGHSGRGLILRFKLPLQNQTEGPLPATISQPRPSISDRAVERQLPLQNQTEGFLTATISQPRPSISDRAVERQLPLQKNQTEGFLTATISQPWPSISGRVVERQLPLHNQTEGFLPATISQPRPSISGRAVERQLPLKGRNPPLLPESRDLQIPARNKQPCFLGRVAEAPLLMRGNSAPEPFVAEEKPCFSGRVAEPVAAESSGAQPCLEHKSSSRIKDTQNRFRDLIVNWTPPTLQFEDPDIGDDDWLFATKKQCAVRSPQRCRPIGDEVPEFGNSMVSLQPRAEYLPECGMYALPYVIPF